MAILVVDDSEEARDIIDATLGSAGYKDVCFASSGPEAMRLLGLNGNPGIEGMDLILLDIVMPGMDGIEACARIRADRRYIDIPIIMVTTQTDMDSLSQAFVAGANDYITKPFNRVEILARIRSALKLKGELDRRRAREQELLSITPRGERVDESSNTIFIDPETGLLKRAALEAHLRALANPAGPLARDSLAIIALTIDSFASYRRDRGDEAAREARSRVARAMRQTDAPLAALLSRYDEGMFVVAASLPTADDAQNLAAALRAAVERLHIQHRESRSADIITLSAGVAFADSAYTSDPRHVLSEAVSALEQAVESGGNCVVPIYIEVSLS